MPYWSKIGLKLVIRTSQTDVLRSRVIAGTTMMTTGSGLDNGTPTADMNPKELAPTSHDQLQWPQWGIFVESHGDKGTETDMPEAKELSALYAQWHKSTDTKAREEIWHKMLALYTSQVFSIGIVNATLQPIVISSKLRNMPDKGTFSFDPTCYLGAYGVDTFWFDKGGN